MSRAITKEVFVHAAPGAVWEALTDADQLTRWFPVHAKVEGGAGGSIWLSWGEGAEGKAPITIWEPRRRLGWAEDRGEARLTVDFHLDARGEGTVVRLVQSGFGDGEDWDAEYHMTQGGWAYFIEHLRFYLEEHPGVPRELIVLREAVSLSGAEAFDRLTRALGFDSASLPSPGGDARFDVTAADGAALTGEVVSLQVSTGQMGIRLDEPGRAIVFLEMEPQQAGCRAACWLSTYGLSADELAAARTRFGRLYAGALELEARP